MLLEDYLNYLNEGRLMNWMKSIGLSIKDTYVEDGRCKQLRNSQSVTYLFHGTRPHYVQSIKKKGLLISMANTRSREDNDINLSSNKELTWFSSTYDPQSPEFGGKAKQITMTIARLETKYLKNFMGTTYTYSKDVPPKDIIWESNPTFLKIVNQSSCLKMQG